MSDDNEPDADEYHKLLEDLARIFAQPFTVPDDTMPDPIIGALAEQCAFKPEAEVNALFERLKPTDKQAFLTHRSLMKERERLAKALSDSLNQPGDDLPAELILADVEMQFTRLGIIHKVAWRLILDRHARGGTIAAAFDRLYAEDETFREAADSTATQLQWTNATGPAE